MTTKWPTQQNGPALRDPTDYSSCTHAHALHQNCNEGGRMARRSTIRTKQPPTSPLALRCPECLGPLRYVDTVLGGANRGSGGIVTNARDAARLNTDTAHERCGPSRT